MGYCVFRNSQSCQDAVISIFFACVYLGKGALMILFGQTLLDLASYLSVEPTSLVPMVTARGIGYGVGAVAAGLTFDRFRNFSFWQLTAIISVLMLCSSSIPISSNVVVLGAVIFLQGICFGSFNNGAHTVLLRLWSENSGPVMQLIHFGFALGAFISPLIAKPFLSEAIHHNSTNFSCTKFTSTYDNAGSGVPLDISAHCLELIKNCSSDLNSSLENVLTSHNCLNDEPSFKFAWAYWILVTPLIISLPAFLVYACTRERACACTEDSKDAIENKQPAGANEETSMTYPDTVAYKLFLFTMLFMFIFLYVGMEHTYGNFLFMYSVNSQLQFSKSQAALLSSVFFGSFTFFRLVAILLALCGIPAWLLLSINVGGGLLGLVILLASPVSPTGIWITSSIVGCSMASVYPNTMVWLSQHGPTTGKSIGLLLLASPVAKTTITTLVGVFVTGSTPIAFVYAVFIGMLLSSVLLVTMFVGVKIWTMLHFRNKDRKKHLYSMVKMDEEERDPDDKEEEEESVQMFAMKECENAL